MFRFTLNYRRLSNITRYSHSLSTLSNCKHTINCFFYVLLSASVFPTAEFLQTMDQCFLNQSIHQIVQIIYGDDLAKEEYRAIDKIEFEAITACKISSIAKYSSEQVSKELTQGFLSQFNFKKPVLQIPSVIVVEDSGESSSQAIECSGQGKGSSSGKKRKEVVEVERGRQGRSKGKKRKSRSSSRRRSSDSTQQQQEEVRSNPFIGFQEHGSILVLQASEANVWREKYQANVKESEKLRKRLAEIEVENEQICQNPFVRAPVELNEAFMEFSIKALSYLKEIGELK
jgi:hypothetical protein